MLVLRCFGVTCLLGATTPTIFAADGYLSMDLVEFKELEAAAQQAVLLEAFEHRLEHGRNISYRCTLVLRNHRYLDGKVGEVVWPGLKFEFQHFRLGESFMMETRPFGEPSNEEPKTVRRTAYDAKNGTSRSATYANPDELTVAAITTGKNPIITTNRYAYWLDGEENPFAEHLFRDLVEAIASYTVVLDEEAQMVNLSVPWKLRGYPDDIGTWSYVLDPRKGFMPVSAKGTWDDRKEDEDPSVPPQRWRIEEFIVTDSKCVGDVWMPLKLREVITASTAEKNVANVYDTTIHEIEHGNVTAQDLIVEFGDKTYVADETKSVEYVADSNGKPREGTLKPLYTKAPAPPATKPGTFSFLIGTNIVAIALFVIFKVVAQRRKRERSVDTP